MSAGNCLRLHEIAEECTRRFHEITKDCMRLHKIASDFPKLLENAQDWLILPE